MANAANAGAEPMAHVKILVVLTLLFSLRVTGQFIVALFSVRWLPAMEQWQSGLIPYPILLALQFVMIVIMYRIRRHPAWPWVLRRSAAHHFASLDKIQRGIRGRHGSAF